MMDGDESINEPGQSRQSFSPRSINEPPVLPPKPEISALEPATCACGDPDFTLDVTGTNFSADCVIRFAGHDEPTTFNEPDTLSTGVKPSLWTSPVTVQCVVHNGPSVSEPVDFVFTEAAAPPEKHAHAVDPDELEEEIEEAEDDDDFKPVHASHHTKVKRKKK